MKKVYYQCRFTQTAPLRISNGDGENTDSDLMRDSRDMPFIPGSSLTGVLRAMLKDPKEAEKLFGEIHDDKLIESRVLVSDAVLPMDCETEQINVTRRDGIGINDYGTTVYGSKYDFETVMTEEEYTAILEWTGEPNEETLVLLHDLMKRISADGISFGARTTRGYGHMNAVVRKKEFAFPEELGSWLEFDAAGMDAFSDCENIEGTATDNGDILIEAQLEIRGGFSVRQYTTCASESKEENTPDYRPLRGTNGPVIPGTSWAGSFRHHMRNTAVVLGFDAELLQEIDRLFGKMPSGQDSLRSGIVFYETAVSGGKDVTVTRTAVDRFTQAPRNGALFTSNVHYGGTGKLIIRIDEAVTDDKLLQLLAVSLYDLNAGLLTFGGEAGVGRGIAEITGLTVNGADALEKLKKGQMDILQKGRQLA